MANTNFNELKFQSNFSFVLFSQLWKKVFLFHNYLFIFMKKSHLPVLGEWHLWSVTTCIHLKLVWAILNMYARTYDHTWNIHITTPENTGYTLNDKALLLGICLLSLKWGCSSFLLTCGKLTDLDFQLILREYFTLYRPQTGTEWFHSLVCNECDKWLETVGPRAQNVTFAKQRYISSQFKCYGEANCACDL